jgi:hypothetical protein
MSSASGAAKLSGIAARAGGTSVATLATCVIVNDATAVTDPDDVTDTADSDDVTDTADSDDVTDTADVSNIADCGIAFDRAAVDRVDLRAVFARDPPALAALGLAARDLAAFLVTFPAAFLPIRFTFAIAAHRTPIRRSGERGNRVRPIRPGRAAISSGQCVVLLGCAEWRL